MKCNVTNCYSVFNNLTVIIEYICRFIPFYCTLYLKSFLLFGSLHFCSLPIIVLKLWTNSCISGVPFTHWLPFPFTVDLLFDLIFSVHRAYCLMWDRTLATVACSSLNKLLRIFLWRQPIFLLMRQKNTLVKKIHINISLRILKNQHQYYIMTTNL